MEKLAEKYLNDACSKEEARKVLRWFQTLAGKSFLEQRLDSDISKKGIQEVSPEEMVSGQKKNQPIDLGYSHRKRAFAQSFYTKAAVAVVMLLVCAGSYWYFQFSSKQQVYSKKEYITGPGQHKEISMNDGTQIQLNENSKVWWTNDPSSKYRTVQLRGEAYFDVIHNEKRSFSVLTKGIRIKDVGTAFDVKSRANEHEVQIAVVDGKVSFKKKGVSEKRAVELIKGQFSSFDLSENLIKVSQFAVNNYLSWMNHRIEFKEAPLYKVARQLNHLYGLQSEFRSNDLKHLTITASFVAKSPQQVLSVIAQTLNLNYKINNKKVYWHDG